MPRHFLLPTASATGLALYAARRTIGIANLSKTLFNALIPGLVGACLLTGCASDFTRFYEPAPNSHGSLVTPQGSPLFKYSVDRDRDDKQLAREGYVLIGSSRFLYHTWLPPLYEGAMRQGMKIGAAVVLLHLHYTGFLEEAWVSTSYWAYPVDEGGGAARDSAGAAGCHLQSLTDCTNPFVLFYEPAKNSHGSPIAPQATPLFKWSRDPQSDGNQLMREGYALLGVSSFITCQDVSSYKDQAATQGMKVGAAVVVLQVDSTDVVWNHLRTMSVAASYWAEPQHPVDR